MHTPSGTRGFGLFEQFLAVRRMQQVLAVVPDELRTGTLVDLGCGCPSLLCLHSSFTKKIGVDMRTCNACVAQHEYSFVQHEINGELPLPFEDASTDVVTMLAVVEHIPPTALKHVLTEVRRILKAKGVFILTTPAHWTGPLLQTLATCRLVSSEEIGDHKQLFSVCALHTLLDAAGFSGERTHGWFEVRCNMWVCARAE